MENISLPEKELDYDEWLEFFRKQPAGKLAQFERLKNEIPTEGYAALKRWQEILDNPSKMDKLYQGRLKAQAEQDIMQIAVSDDDEAFYEALIKENVQQLNTSNISQQEVARITQNINIFRKELREIRSRKPKKGTVLEKVLEKAAIPPKSKKPAKKQGSKTASKGSVKKKTSKVSSGKEKDGKLADWEPNITKSYENFYKCDGKMAVPITFLIKAVRESGNFYNRHNVPVKNAVYSLLNSNDGRYHYYEILDVLSNGKVNGKNKYKRLIIWEVYK